MKTFLILIVLCASAALTDCHFFHTWFPRANRGKRCYLKYETPYGPKTGFIEPGQQMRHPTEYCAMLKCNKGTLTTQRCKLPQVLRPGCVVIRPALNADFPLCCDFRIQCSDDC